MYIYFLPDYTQSSCVAYVRRARHPALGCWPTVGCSRSVSASPKGATLPPPCTPLRSSSRLQRALVCSSSPMRCSTSPSPQARSSRLIWCCGCTKRALMLGTLAYALPPLAWLKPVLELTLPANLLEGTHTHTRTHTHITQHNTSQHIYKHTHTHTHTHIYTYHRYQTPGRGVSRCGVVRSWPQKTAFYLVLRADGKMFLPFSSGSRKFG